MLKKLALIALLTLVLLSSQGGSAIGAKPNTTPHEITSQDLSAFADAFFVEKMETLKVPGAALVVVDGDETLLSKGYGVANLETGTPATSETVFRAGSISKLFTATAIMQLVEQGKIDLQADVNDYLTAFKLETSYPEPVTVADLLLHTSHKTY